MENRVCEVYYDLVRQGFGLGSIPLFALVIFVIGGCHYLFFDRIYPRNSSPNGRLIGLVFFWGVGGAVMLWSILGSYFQYADLVARYSHRQFRVVEGPVYNFSPLDPHKRDIAERFWVGGHMFSYSSYISRFGFQQIHAEGSPIRNGLPVRVSFIDDSIVKLEMCGK